MDLRESALNKNAHLLCCLFIAPLFNTNLTSGEGQYAARQARVIHERQHGKESFKINL